MSYPRTYIAPFTNRDPFFANVFDRFFAPVYTPGNNSAAANHISPRVDVLESESKFKLVVDLPGYTKDNVSIDIHEGVLTLKANYAQASTDESDENSNKAPTKKSVNEYMHVRTERVAGQFERRFTLDETVDTEAVHAKLENGVLEITLPKLAPQKAAAKKVAID